MKLSKLERLAIEVAISAPEKQNETTFAARVPWSIVHALRAELERKGVDWRPIAARYRAMLDENSKAYHAERARRFQEAHAEVKA